MRDTTAPVRERRPPRSPLKPTGPSGATVDLLRDGDDAVSGSLAATCTPASGSVFAAGHDDGHVHGDRRDGNTGSATFTVTVRDTTAPVVTRARAHHR